jgi:hypothetical protein
MAVTPVAGTVKVRLPRSSGYVGLSAAGSVPSGALVDARAGTVELRSALDAAGHTQAASVRGAVFEVRQPKDGEGMTDLILRGGRPRGCPARGSAAVARAAAVPAASGKPRTSRLWAKDDHGRFRTRGRDSAATVRGTEWITQETRPARSRKWSRAPSTSSTRTPSAPSASARAQPPRARRALSAVHLNAAGVL